MVLGTRDRSWGVRPIGLSDPQGAAPPRPPQFYWLWAPLNFPDRFMLYHNNADAEWQAVEHRFGDRRARTTPNPFTWRSCGSQLDFKSGTRHAKHAVIEARDPQRQRVAARSLRRNSISTCRASATCIPNGGMAITRARIAMGYDTYDLASVNENDPRFLHVQAFVTARLSGPDGERVGAGVLEQLIIGPHAPSGFKDILDPAP